MKKLFLTLVVALLSTAASFAQAPEFTSAQLRLRNDIQSFIRAEGFVPEIDSDGDVKFKKEGLVYYVSIDERDTDPMYVRLFRYHSYTTSRTHAKIVAHAADFCIKKMAKVVTFDDSYYVQSELYLTSAEAFKNIFYKMLSQVDAVEEAISEVCD